MISKRFYIPALILWSLFTFSLIAVESGVATGLVVVITVLSLVGMVLNYINDQKENHKRILDLEERVDTLYEYIISEKRRDIEED